MGRPGKHLEELASVSKELYAPLRFKLIKLYENKNGMD